MMLKKAKSIVAEFLPTGQLLVLNQATERTYILNESAAFFLLNSDGLTKFQAIQNYIQNYSKIEPNNQKLSTDAEYLYKFFAESGILEVQFCE